MEGLQAAGVLIGWLGAALIALAEARRGLALGLALVGTGLGLVAALAGTPLTAALLAGGGLLSGCLRLRDAPRGWGLLPPGSTPRLVLSLACLALGALVGLSLVGGPGGALRVASFSVAGLAAGRLMGFVQRAPALAAAAAMALALGLLGGTGTPAVGAAVAVALGALPGTEREVVG